MKRALIIGLIVLPAAVGVAGAAGPAAAATPPRAQLEQFVCQKASNQLNRAIAVTAVMRPVTGTQRLAIKFELQRLAPRSPSFVNVRGGDLGEWRYPTHPPTLGQQPGDVWRLTKEVATLQAPDVYRFRVVFRWIGVQGRVLQSTVLLSDRCSEPR